MHKYSVLARIIYAEIQCVSKDHLCTCKYSVLARIICAQIQCEQGSFVHKYSVSKGHLCTIQI